VRAGALLRHHLRSPAEGNQPFPRPGGATTGRPPGRNPNPGPGPLARSRSFPEDPPVERALPPRKPVESSTAPSAWKQPQMSAQPEVRAAPGLAETENFASLRSGGQSGGGQPRPPKLRDFPSMHPRGRIHEGKPELRPAERDGKWVGGVVWCVANRWCGSLWWYLDSIFFSRPLRSEAPPIPAGEPPLCVSRKHPRKSAGITDNLFCFSNVKRIRASSSPQTNFKGAAAGPDGGLSSLRPASPRSASPRPPPRPQQKFFRKVSPVLGERGVMALERGQITSAAGLAGAGTTQKASQSRGRLAKDG